MSRKPMDVSGFCNTQHHDLCKHEFDFGSDYNNRYFTCQCQCHNKKGK